MKRLAIALLLIFFFYPGIFAQPDMGIAGSVEWEAMRLNAAISLDLASAGIRIPSGRTRAQSLLSAGFLNLLRPSILELQVDSSSTVADIIARGQISMQEIEAIALRADSVAPALSPDMQKISASYSISMESFVSALLSHNRPSPVSRILNPISTARYTGIIIIAADELPVYGMRSTALAIPCLFPKIWDSEMNLIYDRNMLETARQETDFQNAAWANTVRYSSIDNIFENNPSGLSARLQEIAGHRPLRIFARGVFGTNPTDLIIDRSDALLILSSEENRRLLSQGRIVFILDDSVLRSEFDSGKEPQL